MKVEYHRKFIKIFNKLPVKIQSKFYERLRLFGNNPLHSLLDNHSVGAAYPGFWSINVTGDFRALYERTGVNTITFMKIGTHSELYK